MALCDSIKRTSTCRCRDIMHAPAHVHSTPEGARSALPAAQLGDRTITTLCACERTLCARRRRRHTANIWVISRGFQRSPPARKQAFFGAVRSSERSIDSRHFANWTGVDMVSRARTSTNLQPGASPALPPAEWAPGRESPPMKKGAMRSANIPTDVTQPTNDAVESCGQQEAGYD